MSTISKVLIVVIFVLSVAFAVSSALLMTKQESWHDKYAKDKRDWEQTSQDQEAKLKAAEQGLQETKAAFSKTNEELQKYKQERTEVENERNRLQTENASREKRLNELGASFTAIKAGIEVWSQRNEKLQKELNDTYAKLKEAEDTQRQLKAERDKATVERDEMTKKLAEMEAHKKDLEDRLARASEALDKLAKRGDINLEEVVTGAQKPIDGRVLEVDPVSNVVVINVGKEQGVGLGYSFTVYRNGEYVGEIRVDQLKDDLAGATPVAGTMKSDIRKGDNVTTRIR